MKMKFEKEHISSRFTLILAFVFIGVVVISELEELFPLPKEKKASPLKGGVPKELQMLS